MEGYYAFMGSGFSDHRNFCRFARIAWGFWDRSTNRQNAICDFLDPVFRLFDLLAFLPRANSRAIAVDSLLPTRYNVLLSR